jgi:peptidoglycan/LPS O-acetylase OafA/YrhL
MGPNKIYFPNLNGIRFIAALLVIITHVEQTKSIFKLPTIWGGVGVLSGIISIIGTQGVVLFFVLSGFLITYLLIAEEGFSGTIKVKNFYLRRILRIWPLYMLIVFSSLFIFPHIRLLNLPGFDIETVQQSIGLKILLYVFFYSNLVLYLFGIIPYAAQTWSIGTEEQFYIVWPVVVKYVRKNRLFLMLGIVFFYNLIWYLLNSHLSDFIPHKGLFQTFWGGFTIDCMAIGGFFAVILFQKHYILNWFLNNYIFYLSIIAVILSYTFGVHYSFLNSIFYSCLYGIIILNFAANRSIFISLENKVLNYLGNISYGLYMLHPLGITLAIKLTMKTGSVSNWLIYTLTILFTIGLSSISYRWYESYFLKFKSGFAVIKSGSKE